MNLIRKSYASIEDKTHSDILNIESQIKEIYLEPKKEDILIVQSLLEFIKKNNLSTFTGTGEWNWLEKNARSEYLESLNNCDEKKLSELFCNMFRNDVTYGYLSPSFKDIKDDKKWKNVLSNILCNIDSCIEFTNIKTLNSLVTENNICAPYGVKHSNGYILPDSPRHYYYAYKINKICKKINNPIIYEIGGGYGGLINFLYKFNEVNYTYIGIDLLPGLISTYYYLKKNNLNVNLLNNINNVVKGEINLIPFEIFKEQNISNIDVNLIFNSRSLCEMSEETIDFYFKFINNSKTNYIYHENSNYVLFPESERHLEIIGSQFPVNNDKFYLESIQITPFTGGSGRYREFLYSLI